MKHVSIDQKGFGVVEILIILAVVVVVGVTGFVLMNHKNTTPKTSPTVTATAPANENKQVIAAAYKYCATLTTAGKTESFFLSSINGKAVVYSNNGSTASMSGACYDTAGAAPTSGSTYVFTKDSSGTWVYSTTHQ